MSFAPAINSPSVSAYPFSTIRNANQLSPPVLALLHNAPTSLELVPSVVPTSVVLIFVVSSAIVYSPPSKIAVNTFSI